MTAALQTEQQWLERLPVLPKTTSADPTPFCGAGSGGGWRLWPNGGRGASRAAGSSGYDPPLFRVRQAAV